ncbi:MAG: hypothetical protein AAGG01_07295 [Planctomycetota bacterium]
MASGARSIAEGEVEVSPSQIRDVSGQLNALFIPMLHDGVTSDVIVYLDSPLTGSVGQPSCGPSAFNSVESLSATRAFGSAQVLDNNLRLQAQWLPPGNVCYFVNGTQEDFVPVVPGSSGFLCVGGGLGRHSAPGSIGVASAQGQFELLLDLMALPGPSGLAAALPGESRTFQAWYRDVAPDGTPTSQFTDAVTVLFE